MPYLYNKLHTFFSSLFNNGNIYNINYIALIKAIYIWRIHSILEYKYFHRLISLIIYVLLKFEQTFIKCKFSMRLPIFFIFCNSILIYYLKKSVSFLATYYIAMQRAWSTASQIMMRWEGQGRLSHDWYCTIHIFNYSRWKLQFHFLTYHLKVCLIIFLKILLL